MNRAVILSLVVVFIVVSIIVLEFSKSDRADTERTLLTVESTDERISEKADKYPRAVELVDPEGYINSDAFLLQDYIGKKIILIDFWTYSCINCQRTLPYLNAWHEAYGDEGLLIVGVHTPEFGFEEKIENVEKAVTKYGVQYPVVQDNDMQTWRAYENRYWPHKYLIDIDGFIMYDHIGEGGYAQTEQQIRELLDERRLVLGLDDMEQELVIVDVEAPSFREIQTRETYFGYAFSRGQLGNDEGWNPGEIVEYKVPVKQEPNLFYLGGTWMNNPDSMKVVSEEGSVTITYTAKQINVVAGSDEQKEILVFVDGEEKKSITISNHDLYTLYEASAYGTRTVTFSAPRGTSIYTFTYG